MKAKGIVKFVQRKMNNIRFDVCFSTPPNVIAVTCSRKDDFAEDRPGIIVDPKCYLNGVRISHFRRQSILSCS